jgi:hypothetical protein
MLQFVAINTEKQDKEKNIYPFKLRKFLDLIQSKEMVRLPKFYCGTCAICLKNTYYEGQNLGTKLNVVVT